jgi:hypothetical protein
VGRPGEGRFVVHGRYSDCRFAYSTTSRTGRAIGNCGPVWAGDHPAGAVPSGLERTVFPMVMRKWSIHAVPSQLPKLRVAGSSPVPRSAGLWTSPASDEASSPTPPQPAGPTTR